MLSARALFMPETQIAPSFESLGLPENELDLIDRLGLVTPTPIQSLAIPVALKGNDVIGIAQTGTGKTLAFALPISARLQPDRLALVLAPTRELAEQIAVTFQKLELKTALLIGGEGMLKQKQQLRNRPDVIVATPGRLEDHVRQGFKQLKYAEIVVLDEADRMLDMGFAPSIHRILGHVPAVRQTMLFSATMPKEIAQLADTYLNRPQRLDVVPQGTTAEGIDQELVVVEKDQKPGLLGDLLADHDGSILVFARTRHGARKIAHSIRMLGHSAAEIHADRTLAQRRAALEGFKTGEHRVLVATDIAARGIDVKDISLVINYDVPEKPEDYVHRIGRTGRAGSRGLAIMIATPEQRRDVMDIERLMRFQIPVSRRSRLQFPADGPTAERSPRRRKGPQTPRTEAPTQTDRPFIPRKPRPAPKPVSEEAAPKPVEPKSYREHQGHGGPRPKRKFSGSKPAFDGPKPKRNHSGPKPDAAPKPAENSGAPKKPKRFVANKPKRFAGPKPAKAGARPFGRAPKKRR